MHAVYIPEISVDIEKEAARLKLILEERDNVNIFISEGAGVKDIVAEMEKQGKEVQRVALGHVSSTRSTPNMAVACPP